MARENVLFWTHNCDQERANEVCGVHGFTVGVTTSHKKINRGIAIGGQGATTLRVRGVAKRGNPGDTIIISGGSLGKPQRKRIRFKVAIG